MNVDRDILFLSLLPRLPGGACCQSGTVGSETLKPSNSRRQAKQNGLRYRWLLFRLAIPAFLIPPIRRCEHW